MRLNHQEPGQASLEVEWIFKESTVTGAYATSPMKLLTPRSRGRCVCSYASNFGGGLVAGDQTRLDLRVGARASCFLGTQASTKVYRNPNSLPCGHVTHAAVETDALLVFTPSPVQPFAHSSYDQRQKFHLAPGASLALLDWFSSGRSARGERWAFERLSMRNEVWQNSPPEASGETKIPSAEIGSVKSNADRCVFVDSCVLDPKDGSLTGEHRMGRFNCFAMLVVLGAQLKALADQILNEVGQLSVKRRAQLLISASPLECGAVLRIAGEQVAEVDLYLRKRLATLSELLGEDPWSRRW